MAYADFLLKNTMFALSPMVLHAKTGQSDYLYLTAMETGDTDNNITVKITADADGVLVFDVSTLVRDLLRRRFVPGGIVPNDSNPYGTKMDIMVSNEYEVTTKVLWARKDSALCDAINFGFTPANPAWLYPNGYVYRKGAPEGVLSGYGYLYTHPSVHYKNKLTGVIKQLIPYGSASFTMYDDVFNYRDSILSTIEPGEYLLYLQGNQTRMPLDLTVEECFPTDAIKDGTMAYVRFCNQWGGISYALLKVTQRSVKNKNTYIHKLYALDADPNTETINSVYPDRLMTGQEINPSFKAGKDKLNRAELEELQSILVSPMVDMYDANTGEWIPVYPADSTITETNDALQEITIDFNLNAEGF